MGGEIPIFEPPKNLDMSDIKTLTKNVGTKGINKQTELLKVKLPNTNKKP